MTESRRRSIGGRQGFRLHYLAALLLAACQAPTWTPREDLAAWPDEAGAALPIPVALEALPWLGEVSTYGERGIYPGRGSSGAVGLGNGRCFGLVGLESPWNSLTNAVGPGYDRDVGFFGDSAVFLAIDGVAMPMEEEAVQRTRGAGVARTWGRVRELELLTTDAAPPDFSGILRVITVRNPSASAVRGASVEVHLRRAADEDVPSDPSALVQTRGRHTLRISCEGGQAEGELLRVPLPEVAAHDEISFTCTWMMGEGAPADLDAVALLEATYARDQAALSEAATLSASDPKVADLLEGIHLALMAQTAESGLVSPMSRYTRAWLRDAEGPVRYALASGRWEAAQALLDAQYLSLVAEGGILNSFPSDPDLTAISLPEDPETFWMEGAFMDGREPVEAPSYPVLLEHQLWLRTGTTPDPGRLAMLEAALARQEDEGGLMRFSGDETYRFNLATAAGSALPEEAGYSAGSSFLFVAAAEALEAMGGEAPRGRADVIRAATEVYFWQEEGGFYSPMVFFEGGAYAHPFEDVWPHWVGYPEEARVRRHIEAASAQLQRADGSFLSANAEGTGENPGYTGMVPGFALSALAWAEHPGADAAFHAVDLSATPLGTFAEGHLADHRAMALLHDATGLGGDVSARYRPWEGGIVGTAVWEYLVGARYEGGGLTLHPHIPEGWSFWEARALRAAEGRYDLRVEGYEEGLRAVVSGEIRATLTLSEATPFARAWVNGEPLEPSADGKVVTEIEGTTEIIAAFERSPRPALPPAR